jgi:hypothetical protein
MVERQDIYGTPEYEALSLEERLAYWHRWNFEVPTIFGGIERVVAHFERKAERRIIGCCLYEKVEREESAKSCRYQGSVVPREPRAGERIQSTILSPSQKYINPYCVKTLMITS